MRIKGSEKGGGMTCDNPGRWGGKCGYSLALMPVYVKKGEELKEICSAVICFKCRKFKRLDNGRVLCVGPWVRKANYKLFDIPLDWWQGDWPWRQKFAWEAVTLLGEKEGESCKDIVLDFDEVAARVDKVLMPNPGFNYELREIFGMAEED